MTDRHGVRTIDARRAAGQVRARLALPGAGRRGSATAGPHAVQAFGTKLVVFADSARRSCTCSTRTAGTWAAT